MFGGLDPMRYVPTSLPSLGGVGESMLSGGKAIAESLGSAIMAPGRYLGPKTDTYIGSASRSMYNAIGGMVGAEVIEAPQVHYESTMQPLSPEEVKPHLKYMALAAYGHTSSSEKLTEPFGFEAVDPESLGVNLKAVRGDIEIKGGTVTPKKGEPYETNKVYTDKNTGLKVAVSVNREMGEIVLSYGDASSLSAEFEKSDANEAWQNQYIGVIGNLMGARPELYQQADELTGAILDQLKSNEEFKDFSVKLAGQCLGGSLAQYVALKRSDGETMLRAHCFNTFPMGAGLQSELGEEKLEMAGVLVTHVSVESDYVSDMRGVGYIDAALTEMGIKTPGNFGRRFSIPTAYKNKMQATHAFVFGSAMEYLEMGKRTTPQGLKSAQGGQTLLDS